MSEPDLRTEYTAMAARAGIIIPADREAAMFEAFKSLRALLATLHKPFPYSIEPAFIAPPPVGTEPGQSA